MSAREWDRHRVASSVAVGWLAGMGCMNEAPKADAELSVLDYAPAASSVDLDSSEDAGGTGAGGSDGGSDDWDGPDVTPVPDAAWGGLGVVLHTMDCTLLFTLLGEQVPCDDCALAFELQGDLVEDDCGLGVDEIDFQLEVREGSVYGFDSYWGAATYGGGRLSWRGYSSYYDYYEYYGYIEY